MSDQRTTILSMSKSVIPLAMLIPLLVACLGVGGTWYVTKERVEELRAHDAAHEAQIDELQARHAAEHEQIEVLKVNIEYIRAAVERIETKIK